MCVYDSSQTKTLCMLCVLGVLSHCKREKNYVKFNLKYMSSTHTHIYPFHTWL